MALILAEPVKAAKKEIGDCHPIAVVRGHSDLDGQLLYISPDAHASWQNENQPSRQRSIFD